FYYISFIIFFFFSSSRRHTISKRDWSSDVCSSDLNNQGSKMKQALNDAWAFLYPMLPYLFIGVFIGAFIYGFIPADFITKYASGDGIFSVMIASVIGVPM